MSSVLVLLVTIDVAVVIWGVPLPSFYILGGRGYMESPRVDYNYSPNMNLSLVFLIIRFDLIRVGLICGSYSTTILL
jgi:hypothetical protein